MNYYNPYTGGSKKRLIRRITAVVLSVLVTIGATVVFGNYLKKKAESSSDNDYAGIGRDDVSASTEGVVIIPPSDGGSGCSESVTGVCVPLGFVPDKEPVGTGDPQMTESFADSFNRRLGIAAVGNTGVLIPLTGEDGFLLYNSVRAAEASRLPANPLLPNMDDLKKAVSSAKAKNLRTTALIISGVELRGTEYEIGEAIEADQRIAADAKDAGFDELIVVSVVSDPSDISGETSPVILRYLKQLTEVASDMDIGLSLPLSIYEDATLSPSIELFISTSVFLAMDLSEEQSTAEYMDFICENLAGTLSVYNMRMLLAPTDTDIGDTITSKLNSANHNNYLYTVVPADPPEPPPVTAGTDFTETEETISDI